MIEYDLKKTFVTTQVSAELLAVRTVSLAKGKRASNKNTPNIEDLVRKYNKLYNKISTTIDEVDNED